MMSFVSSVNCNILPFDFKELCFIVYLDLFLLTCSYANFRMLFLVLSSDL